MPEQVISKSLQTTTHFVPSLKTETTEIVQDHLKSRIPELKLKVKVKSINNNVYV